jgi:hypothetical protein
VKRPQKVREVYLELKQVLGEQVAAGELLACASQLVRIAEKDEVEPRYGADNGPVPFEETTLDVLFDRWGWKLVSQDSYSQDDAVSCRDHARLIDQLFAKAA